MRRQDFHYTLPEALIADSPTAQRRDSRLLQLDGRRHLLKDGVFSDVLELVAPGDLMVFNDTRVIPARLFGRKETGGQVEVLIERIVDTHRVLSHVRASKSPRPGTGIVLTDGTRVEVAGRQGQLFELRFPEPALQKLEAIGRMPLPPYIEREDVAADRERYQTVYSNRPGAVAAPTAGLHFDEAMLDQLRERGVQIAFVTLHVGAGTFQPVRVDDIRTHQMHSEVMELSEAVCAAVRATKAAGKRVIAVGTTSMRCLETAGSSGEIRPFQGDTNIFIYPSYRFQVVDALITNFHLPESTLLMLVCAFAGYTQTMHAYQHAVQQCYRFFSYGDAMFVHHNPDAVGELP